jgi:hypothetical protein
MSTLERCSYQLTGSGSHLLFKDEWARCKVCKYDPENNKRCHNYSPTVYNDFPITIIYDNANKELELVASEL